MAKLPGVEYNRSDMGGGRPTARIDGSAVAEGAQRFAGSVERATDAQARATGIVGDALSRMAEQQAAAGRLTAQAGDAAGRALQQTGAEEGRAIQQVARTAGQTIDSAGQAVGGAIQRGGEAMARAEIAAGSATAQGLQAFGKGVLTLGDTIKEMNDSRERLEFMRARTDFRAKAIMARSEFKNDNDYATMPDRYNKRIGEIMSESSGLIASPQMRERFTTLQADEIAKENYWANERAYNVKGDVQRASTTQQLFDLKEAALRADTPEDRAKIFDSANTLIAETYGSGYWTAEQAQKARQEFGKEFGTAWVQSRPLDEQARLLRVAPKNIDETVDRIIGVESGGNAKAKNPNSSAFGLGQFTNATWLETVKTSRPDIAEGKSDAQLLALRADPGLSREMTKALAQKNAGVLQAAGVEANPGTIYLAHFLGAGTAAKVLQADPSTPVESLVGADAVNANQSILRGKTAGAVAAWAANKMGSDYKTGTPVDFIPATERQRLATQADGAILKRDTEAAAQRTELYERSIIDASAGIAPLPPRSVIEQDPMLTEPKRNTLLRSYDGAAKDVQIYQNALQRFQAGAPFNPYADDDRKAADALFKGLGSTPQALQQIVDRTGVLPKTAAVGILGQLVSNKPEQVAAGLETVAKLQARNDNIFVGVPQGDDLQKAATEYLHYTQDLGLTAEQAAKRYLEYNAPEYRSQVKARIKSENVDEIIKKKLSIDDLRKSFQTAPVDLWFNRPTADFSPAARDVLMKSYGELFQDNYLENGNVALSKKLATDQLKKVWGVSHFNGSISGTVMRFPPERAPAYAGVENVVDGIAGQAVEAIKGETGSDVDRSKIRLTPLPGGQTAQAYAAGKPPPYLLSWEDKNGVVQVLSGKAFVADPQVMRDRQTAERQKFFERGRAVDEVRRDLSESWAGTDSRMPLGVQ